MPDVEWAQLTYLNTLSMDLVRKGILERQKIYKKEVEREKEILKAKKDSDIEEWLQSFDVKVPF